MKTECWLWAGSTDRNGYGQRSWHGKNYMIHRLMYENFIGPIPTGMTLDHLCRVPTCINPSHLQIVSHKTNIERGLGISSINRIKTHCANGHEFTEENTVYYHKQWRSCRQCYRDKYNRTKLMELHA